MRSRADGIIFNNGILALFHSAAASSTTGPDHLKQDKEGSGNDASSWSVDDVIRFVQEADPQTLGPHVELFRKHVSISCIGTVLSVMCKGQQTPRLQWFSLTVLHHAVTWVNKLFLSLLKAYQTRISTIQCLNQVIVVWIELF